MSENIISDARIHVSSMFCVPFEQSYVEVCINGTWKQLFEFYPDELHFSRNDFIGKTWEQAENLKYKRDLEYLTS